MKIKRNIHRERDDVELCIKELMYRAPGIILLTTDARSSRIYRRKIVTTGH